MAITKKAKMTFDVLIEAGAEHRLCLVESVDRRSGRKVFVLCESYEQDGAVHLNPLARLFNGNPFNEVAPPGVDAPKLI